MIVYDSNQKKAGQFLKAKTTAWYPSGNEDDQYRIEYDENWLTLPDAVKNTAIGILKKHRDQQPVPPN